MDGMFYRQWSSFQAKNKMMKEQHNVTYEKYFEIYSILRSDKLKKIEK